MNKKIQLILFVILLIFAFFAGVTYSDSIKTHAGWLFENKEEEVELPDLSSENSGIEIGATVDENGESMSNSVKEAPAAVAAPQETAPMDDVSASPAAAPATAVKAPVKK